MAKSVSIFTSQLLHYAALLACLFAIVSFALFAVNEVSGAAHHQAAEIAPQGPALGPALTPRTKTGPGPARRTIDDVAHTLESPFAAALSGSSNAWVINGGKTLAVLLVYGLGLGYAARAMRVHA